MDVSDDQTKTIEQLTYAFSSGIAPLESPSMPACCCQHNDCPNYEAWQKMKLRLEERLLLTVGGNITLPGRKSIDFNLDIGHELLQRHQELSQNFRRKAEGQESPTGTEQSRTRVSELIEEKQRLEKQLNQALVMSEVTEASSETLHQELKDARQTIAHLTVDNAKYTKLEARLLEVTKERDDLKQEREIESAKAKRTEQDIVQLHLKNSKLRSEIQQLQEELEQRDAHQKEYKGSLVQSTRAQIHRLYAKFSLTAASESIELKKSVEALCEHNEELMQYNRELEGFLVDARDEIHALRQEIEEQGINVQTLQHTGHDDPQETSEDALDVDVKIMYENSDSNVHENSQQSLTILLVRLSSPVHELQD
ncbi:hypothetical protein F5878DRAFT_666775 [Lentinula raphanica]|uniref:Uncharacterized protein n=1 Tax=Lentinula raphanica TaxID=153919 RepID=A0AA38NX23_9AGAR|nr:hypothetical protein F5878DRAFT_666775 [Lentinula raphanica]